MPKIENWDNLPEGIRRHLIDRMQDRAITIADLNQLRLWSQTQRYRTVTGTRTAVRSRSADRAHIPRRSCFVAKLPKANPSMHPKDLFANRACHICGV